jgi:hypothetical protein
MTENIGKERFHAQRSCQPDAGVESPLFSVADAATFNRLH